MEYFWYDYEMTGRWPRVDRPVQFGGIRTDEALNEIGTPVTLYCKPSQDSLPQVSACMVHGIAPQVAQEKGLTEHEFATEVYRHLTKNGTCVVGFNAMRFDHVVTQFLFYRNLREPYRWHWADGNSKWDIINLCRAVFALRPDGLEWPMTEEGDRPSFKLQHLARANGITADKEHDALADVRTTLRLAKLLQEKKPRMYNYFLGLRDKRKVDSLTQDTFVHVSGKVLAQRQKATVMARLGFDTYVYAYDLSVDPSEVFSAAKGAALLEKGSAGEFALTRFRPNAVPFVLDFKLHGVLSKARQDMVDQMGLNLDQLQRNYRKLQQFSCLFERVRDAFEAEWPTGAGMDVDEALYSGGFISNYDRRLLSGILRTTDHPSSRWERHPFRDSRLPELVFRFRARNFPESLSRADAARWKSHCREKIFERIDEKEMTLFEHYRLEIRRRRKQEVDADKLALLDQLEDYGRSLQSAVHG